MRRLESYAQCEENRAQRQMMQMMMANLMRCNNPISNVIRNIEHTSATDGNHNVNAAKVNAARNKKTDKDNESIDKFVLFIFQLLK